MTKEQVKKIATEIKAQSNQIIDDEIGEILTAMETGERLHHVGSGRFLYRWGMGITFEPSGETIMVTCKATWGIKRNVETSGQVQLEPDMLTNVE